MNVPFELNAFVDRLASDAGLKLSLALVHFLWQGVLIAAAAAVLMRLVGRRSPQRRYLIGVVGMIAMAVAPIVTFCLVEPPDWSSFIVEEDSSPDFSSFESAELELLLATLESGSDMAPAVETAPPARPLTWPERVRLYQPYALLLWLVGTGLFALRLGIGLHATWRFGRKRRSLPEAWRDTAARVASRLGMTTPRIFVSDRIVEAVAVGLLKPMVLLPAAWIGNVPPDVLEAVLAHEIAHLRRYDLWVNLLQRIVEAALFYHPAVWWLSRRIRVEREYCCDELAAEVVSGRAAYARALEFVAKERVASTRRPTLAAALAAGMGGSNMALLDRVRRVLGSDVKPSRGTWLSEGLLVLAVPVALWAGIATVAPAVATADDEVKAQNSDDISEADAHIGDVEYWRERGVEPGMIVVLEGGVNGSPVDLATGEPVPNPHVEFLGNLTVHPAPVPARGMKNILLNFRTDAGNLPAGGVDPANAPLSSRGDSDVGNALQELREEMQSLRKQLDEVRQGGVERNLKEFLAEHREDNERTKAALERRISIHLAEVPFERAIHKFRTAADVNFVIELQGLEDEGIRLNTPVSLDLNSVSIRAALNTLLSPLNLGFVVEDDVVTITSRLRTQGPMEVQTYPVGDLVGSVPITFGKGPGFETGQTGREPAFERLIDLITGAIEPGSWETVGGNGVIRANDATLSLVVRQTQSVHAQIADLLNQLRTLQREHSQRERQEAISRMQAAEKGAAARPINRTHKTTSEKSTPKAELNAAKSYSVRLYQVDDLVEPIKDKVIGGSPELLETLAFLITSEVEPASWERNGGDGMIRPVEDTLSLLVRHSDEVHDQIIGVLAQLRKTQREHAEALVEDAKRRAATTPINRTHKPPTIATGPLKTVNPYTAPKAPASPTKPAVPAAPPLPASPGAKIDRLLRVVPLNIDGKQIEVIVEEFREGEGPAKEIQLRVLSPAEKVELESKMWVKETEADQDEQTRVLREQIERLQREKELNEAAREATENAERRNRQLQSALERFAPGHPALADLKKKAEDAQRQAERQQFLDQVRRLHPVVPPEVVEREIDTILKSRRAEPRQNEAEAARLKAEEAQKHTEELQRKLEEQSKTIEELRNELRKTGSSPSPSQPAKAPQPGDADEPAGENANDVSPDGQSSKADEAAENKDAGTAGKPEERSGVESLLRFLLRNSVPPREDPIGEVLDTRTSTTSGTQFIEVSVGSDAGIGKGHVLYVSRDNILIGRIRISTAYPDRAVGVVVLLEKGNEVQQGDVVTAQPPASLRQFPLVLPPGAPTDSPPVGLDLPSRTFSFHVGFLR